MSDILQDIDLGQVRNDYKEFSEKLKSNPLALHAINDVFRLADTKDWPIPYYKAREQIWPLWFGENGANFLVDYLLNGNRLDETELDETDYKMLQSWYMLFSNIANKAEQYAKNPMGIDFVDAVFNTNETSLGYIIRFFRNDGNHLNFSIKRSNEVLKMISFLLSTFPKMEEIFKEARKDLAEIQEIKEHIDRLNK